MIPETSQPIELGRNSEETGTKLLRNANSQNHYALITGASHGLGRSIAMQLAEKGYGLILVALPDRLLWDTCRQITSKFEVDVKCIPVDLMNPESCFQVSEKVKSFGINISILINNVGMGYVSFFDQTTVSFNRNIVRLNCMVMMELTHLLLPELRKCPNSYVLNVASLAGLFPVPYKAVYSASKHFVRAFSYSLREELIHEGISVTAVFPGSMLTNEDTIRRINSFGPLARICACHPEHVARVSLDAMFERKRSKSPGIVNTIYISLRYIVGYVITMRLVKKGMRKEALSAKEKAFLTLHANRA